MSYKMIRVFKSMVKRSFIYPFLHKINVNKLRASEQKKIMKDWEKNGRTVPVPQLYKRLEIKKYAKAHGINIFVETGTYLGETVDYFKNTFKRVISIELDEKLFTKAQQHFSKQRNVELYQGDSGEVLREILPTISEPCLFWLDGHYSEGITAKGNLNTPIIKELDHIFNHSQFNHVILIDDARCFIGKDDYPTIDYLKEHINRKNSSLKFLVEHDIIRIHN